MLQWLLNDDCNMEGQKQVKEVGNHLMNFFRSIKDFNYTGTKLYTLLKYYLLDLFFFLIYRQLFYVY